MQYSIVPLLYWCYAEVAELFLWSSCTATLVLLGVYVWLLLGNSMATPGETLQLFLYDTSECAVTVQR